MEQPRVVEQQTVVDIVPTSRRSPDKSLPDTAVIVSTLRFEEAVGDFSLTVPTGVDRAELSRGFGLDRIVHDVRRVLVPAEREDVYRLTLTVPPDDLVLKGDAAVILSMPRFVEEADEVWQVEILERTTDPAPEEFTQSHSRGRHLLTWAFDQDPDLEVIWRYVRGSG